MSKNSIYKFRKDVYVPQLWLDLIKVGATAAEADELCLAYVQRFRSKESQVITYEDLQAEVAKLTGEDEEIREMENKLGEYKYQ